MLVPCLQCKSPVFVSGSAVAAGDVRSTCGNCGSALVIERGGVVRLAEPPPGPAAAPQLIVPPSFEPPSHATTMREYAVADDSPMPDESTFYVARQPPVDARHFDSLLGADVRAYVDEAAETPPAQAPAFTGPASFGSDEQMVPVQPPPLPIPPPQLLQDPEPLQAASGPELTPPEHSFVPAEAIHTPINMPYDASGSDDVVLASQGELAPSIPDPPQHVGAQGRYDPPGREKPPALMFPGAHVGGMSGPAREAEQTRLSPVVRAESTGPIAVAEPVLLTDPTPPPEVLSLTQAMPEWSGETLDEAATYAPTFVAATQDDQVASGERQRRGTYPTPASYFDTSDPLAAAEADMYAGHQVVAPTELVGEAFTAMVPPVGTEVPQDTPTAPPLAAPTVSPDDGLDPEELAVLRGHKKRGLWAAAAFVVLAVGGASFAASRGYFGPLINKMGGMMEGAGAPEQQVAEAAKADAPRTEGPVAEPAKADRVVADAPKVDQPAAVPQAAEPAAPPPPAKGAPLAPAAPEKTPAMTEKTPAMTDTPVAAEQKTPGAPSKALQACYAKGNRYLNAKKVSLAIRELNKCLDIDPNYGRTYRSLGVAYMQLGRERSAILAYEKFVDHDPQHKDVPKVREIIADYYRRRKN